jgi:hypothetical protein
MRIQTAKSTNRPRSGRRIRRPFLLVGSGRRSAHLEYSPVPPLGYLRDNMYAVFHRIFSHHQYRHDNSGASAQPVCPTRVVLFPELLSPFCRRKDVPGVSILRVRSLLGSLILQKYMAMQIGRSIFIATGQVFLFEQLSASVLQMIRSCRIPLPRIFYLLGTTSSCVTLLCENERLLYSSPADSARGRQLQLFHVSVSRSCSYLTKSLSPGWRAARKELPGSLFC